MVLTLGEVSLTVPPAVSEDGLSSFQAQIEEGARKHDRNFQHQQQLVTKRERAARSAIENVIPREEEEILIVDTNVLLDLSTPVPESARSARFLEMLPTYARKMGVRIWIPSRILYETTGTASFLSEDGQVHTCHMAYYNADKTNPVRQLIKDAAHLFIPDKGEQNGQVAASYDGYRAIQGDSPITIVYTPEDEKFLKEARKYLGQGRTSQFKEQHRNADLGDYAINQTIKRVKIPGCKISVLTKDRKYAGRGGFMTQLAGNSIPVTWMSTLSFMSFVVDKGWFNDYPPLGEIQGAIKNFNSPR